MANIEEFELEVIQESFFSKKKLGTFLLEIATKTEEDEEMNETCLKRKKLTKESQQQQFNWKDGF